jgi:hypothetical protein
METMIIEITAIQSNRRCGDEGNMSDMNAIGGLLDRIIFSTSFIALETSYSIKSWNKIETHHPILAYFIILILVRPCMSCSRHLFSLTFPPLRF